MEIADGELCPLHAAATCDCAQARASNSANENGFIR
jgi:hypothetical protein